MKCKTQPLGVLAVWMTAVCIGAVGTASAEWALVDSSSFAQLIPAGEQCVVTVRYTAGSLNVSLPAENLTADALAALEVAPDWLRMDLRDNFRRLGDTYQDLYAGMIMDAVDPYVDEICFEVAHLAPQTLSSWMNPDVLVENVESLYAIDAFLPYVEIVDYENGGDYYSTAVYQVEEGESVVEIELPRDHYYWYIVHPKLHKEVPNYINPNTGGPAAPPTGVFWRDFLMNHSDAGYPLLRACLDTCAVLWKSQQNTVDNGAVGALTQWMQDVMTFQSYPHHDQPVRIYRQHIGTCSVHSYLTSAAARAALIPTAVDVMYSDNHKINEFWDRRWIAWEPVNTYIDYPEGYENWGWNIAATFNWRGDSFIWDTTDRYTEVCTLRVNVEDMEGVPVDGARIKIYSSPCVSWGAIAGWTDWSGEREFLLGDSRNFMAQVTSAIGNYPPSGMTTVITNSAVGACYDWDVTLPGTVPAIDVSPDTLPSNPLDEYCLVVEYGVSGEILYGMNFDDGNEFSNRTAPGHIDFFICDEGDYASYAAGQPFSAFEIAEGSSEGAVSFTLVSAENWYAVLSNESNLVMTEEVNVTAKLYVNAGDIVAQEDEGQQWERAHLRWNSPNPFNPDTRIGFDMPCGGTVDLTVYNVSGQKVRTLTHGFRPAGEHVVAWNGEDERGNPVGSGVYFYEMRTDGFRAMKKMVLAR
ncbi:MAG: T9SS type A sorting domain-containing protein [Candidatus Eisenbacteria sp.]|nr:T9SS type A sorting domain-containing protein [Candidatus Eisenbacteria bacterium]